VRIAELSETSSSDIEKLQQHLLKKAAELGADAVVFSSPITYTEQGVTYQPTYSPWGYYAPYWELHRQQWILQRDHLMFSVNQIQRVLADPREKPTIGSQWTDRQQQFVKTLEEL
jgi:hypothetical protein